MLGNSKLENRLTKTFDEMELAIHSNSDRVSANVLPQTTGTELNQRSATAVTCRCPRCNQQGQQREKPDVRLVQILRGQIGWSEGEFFCGKCRKSYFPATSKTGA